MRITSLTLCLVLFGWLFAAPSPSSGAVYFYDNYWKPSAMPEASNPQWDRKQDDGVRTLVPNDYLRIDTTAAAADREYYEIRDDPTIIDFAGPSTVDFRMKVNDTSHGTVASSILALWKHGSGYRYVRYEFDETGVRPKGSEGSKASLDATEWHDYRISLSGNAGGSRTAKLYLLGDTPRLLLSTGSQGSGSTTWSNTIYWGDMFTSDSGSADWAFIGWTGDAALGADDLLVIPEPSTFLAWSLLAALGIAFGWHKRRKK